MPWKEWSDFSRVYSHSLGYLTLTLALLICGKGHAMPSVEISVQELERGYPMRRYVGGGLSVALGGLAASRGARMLAEGDLRSQGERFGAGALTLLGTLRMADGVSRLFGRTYTERRLPEIRELPETSRPLEYALLLQQGVREERRTRWLRSTLRYATAATYFFLYRENPQRNHSFLYSAAGLAAIATIRLVLPTPAQGAYDQFQAGRLLIQPAVLPAGAGVLATLPL